MLIDAESLRECPLKDHFDDYAHLGGTVATLILSRVEEEHLEIIFSAFPAIIKLTLKNIVLLEEDLLNYPKTLEEFQIIDCKINQPLMENWLEAVAATLTSIYIHRSYFTIALEIEGFDSICNLLPTLDNLKYASLEDQSCHITAQLPSVQFLSYNVLREAKEPLDEVLQRLNCEKSLRTLILKNCPKDLNSLKRFESLDHLRIINSVDVNVEKQFKLSKHANTILDVHSFKPVEKNLILKILNDDCLLQICSYLNLSEWFAVKDTHPRFEALSFRYADIEISDQFLRKYPLEEKLQIYQNMSQTARSLSLAGKDWEKVLQHFPGLTKLFLNDWRRDTDSDKDPFKNIHSGLERLKILSGHINRLNESELFARLSPTLTHLTILEPQDLESLRQLENLRELSLSRIKNGMNFSRTFKGMTKLENLSLGFHPLCREVDSFPVMNNLKVLHLWQLSTVVVLRPADFPILEEINLAFGIKYPASDRVLMIDNVLEFTDLKRLSIPIEREMCNTAKLYGLKNLECIMLRARLFDEELIVDIVKNLPKLSQVETWNGFLTLKCEVKLRRVLAEGRRVIRVVSGNKMTRTVTIRHYD